MVRVKRLDFRKSGFTAQGCRFASQGLQGCVETLKTWDRRKPDEPGGQNRRSAWVVWYECWDGLLLRWWRVVS